ncbi:MAG: DUF4956 domain-containing protein [Actinobacteria bacterium]|nr:MAG: DUF4956 domain-containing protein [Actinomycetota bacterium]
MDLLATVSQAAFPYGDFLARLGLDLVAIALFTVLIGLMRDGRRDLFMVCLCFNVGLFVVLTVIATSASATAVGFGLFAMLSIIRLRSEPFTNQELGYFFSAIVLALINGVIAHNMPLAGALDAIVIAGVVIADHPGRGPAVQRREITLDCIHADDAALRADLEHRLGVRVVDFTILEIDYVRDVTRLQIRYVVGDRNSKLPVAP